MSAVLATFVDFKTVRTRGQAQLIFEVPIEQADSALKALGGIPQPATERWVGIALAPKERTIEAKKDKRAWDELDATAQAGMRCNDPEFRAFLKVGTLAEAVQRVRTICLINSRAELNLNEAANLRWRELEAEFQRWLTDRRYKESRTL